MKTGKIISAICVFVVMGGAMNTAHGLAMNAQIRSLLQEKQDKIATLEKCEGNKKGWMIAGISTIGLTAVGVVGNVVMAGKSSKLSEEIVAGKEKLQTNANELERVNNKIDDLSASGNGGGNGSRGGGSSGGGHGPLGNGSREVPGIIGQKCGDNGAGVWFQRADGGNTCLKSGTEVKCQCVRKSCVRDNKLIFSGKVIDESGEIVPFANIKCTSKKGKEFHANGLNVLPDEGGGGSDFYGEFCFDESVPRGAQCEISCVGYNKAVGSIEEMESHKDKLKLCSSTPLSEVFPFETDCKAGSGTGGGGGSGGGTPTPTKAATVSGGSGGLYNCNYTVNRLNANDITVGKYYLSCGQNGNDGCSVGTLVNPKDWVSIRECQSDGKWKEFDVSKLPDCDSDWKEVTRSKSERLWVSSYRVFAEGANPVVISPCKVLEKDFQKVVDQCEKTGGSFWGYKGDLCNCYHSKGLKNKNDFECECENGGTWDDVMERCQ